LSPDELAAQIEKAEAELASTDGAGVTEKATPTTGVRWLVLLLTIVALASCDLHPGNCMGLATGDTLAVTLVEPWDRMSRFTNAATSNPLTCNGMVGLASGQTFTATLTSFMGVNGCFSGVSDEFSVGGWTWQRDPALRGVGGGYVLAGPYLGQMGTCCTGRMDVSVHTDKLPTTPPQAGSPPTATMSFGFNATGSSIGDASCPQHCGGAMVATVARQ
jgi:hypothetical protein